MSNSLRQKMSSMLEAKQTFKEHKAPDIDFKEVKKVAPAWAAQVDEAFEVETLEGTMQGKADDYLMKGIDDELYICDQEIFDKTYEWKKVAAQRIASSWAARVAAGETYDQWMESTAKGMADRLLAAMESDRESQTKVAIELCDESPALCKGNLGIPRSKMPQVGPDFLAYLQEQGIKVARRKVDPGSLKATQKEIHGSMVEHIVGEMIRGQINTKGLIASRDGYILNGHHRWAAVVVFNHRQEGSLKLEINRVDLPIKKLLAMAHSYSGVEYRSLEESMARHATAVRAARLARQSM